MPGPIKFGAGGKGSGTALALADHDHPIPDGPAPTIITRSPAKRGAHASPAHADHGHDIQVSEPNALRYGPALVGKSESLASADHDHEIPEPEMPGEIGPDVVDFQGSGKSFARDTHSHRIYGYALENHVHPHTNLAGGDLHAGASQVAAGFMTVQQVVKLDGIAEGAAALSRETPMSSGVGSAGDGKQAAPWNHVHPIAFGKIEEIALVGTTPSLGTSERAAPVDHAHAHGPCGGGDLHAYAGAAAGFMSPEQCQELIELRREMNDVGGKVDRILRVLKSLDQVL